MMLTFADSAAGSIHTISAINQPATIARIRTTQKLPLGAEALTATSICLVCELKMPVRATARQHAQSVGLAINRTFLSKIAAVKILQEWKGTALMPPRPHEWRMFIRPEELKGLLVQTGFEFKEFCGTSPNVSIPKMISLLRQRAKGKIGFKELGQSFKLVESDDLKILYMGYAVKPVH
jgi:hypothetical protein